jgi:hypothetical protein
MGVQLDRRWTLEAGRAGEDGKKWGTGVGDNPPQIAFTVEQGVSRGMDKATITLTNLNPESIGFLQRERLKIILRGGYPDTQGLIFSGEVARFGVRTSVVTSQSDTDRTTQIEAGTGEVNLQETRFDRSFARNASNLAIIDAVAASLGVIIRDRGLIPEFQYLTGWTHIGSAARALDSLAADIGTDWTLQGDTLIMMPEQSASTQTAAVINRASGLIGRVVQSINGLEFTTLLNPQLRPSRSCVVQAEGITPGTYRIETVKHSGDFEGDSWFSQVFCRFPAGGGAT